MPTEPLRTTSSTSEFSQNVTATAAGIRTISGTIYEDVNGDSNLADAVGRDNVVVRLFRGAGGDDGGGTPDAADTFIGSTLTDISGNYSFTGLSDSTTYWVVVDSKTITPDAGVGVADTVWAEQTYGVAGALTPSGTLATAGALYGGRSATTSDNSTDAAASLATSDHVTRVALSGADATGIDSAFSFNVVTNTEGGDFTQDDDVANPRSVQGSLRQFIQNANATTGANEMRFVPAVATNAVSGGDSWWRITVSNGASGTLTSNGLPPITDAGTIIDGRAYSSADGITILNTNDATLGNATVVGGVVGLGADAIAGTGDEVPLLDLNGPELEIVEDGTAQIRVGIDIQADDTEVRRIAISGFGNDNPDSANLFTEADIRVGIAGGGDTGSSFSGILIEDNVIGSASAASWADPGGIFRSASGIVVNGPDNGILRDNLIGFAGRFGAFITNDSQGWTVSGNQFTQNAQNNAAQDGLDFGNLSDTATVTGNLFYQNVGGGIDMYRGDGGHTIQNNTFIGNGTGGSENSSIRLYGSGTTIELNVFESAVGPAVLVVSQDDGPPNVAASGNRISQNSFSGSGGPSIDLVAEGGPTTWDPSNSSGDGQTPNDGSTNANSGNIGLDYPVITGANKSGSTTTVSGTAATGVTSVEVYKATAAAGFGEGTQYLGTAAVVGGLWSLGFTDGTVTLNVGEYVSVIGIDGSNNTSEFGQNFTVVGGTSTLTVSDVSVNEAAGTLTFVVTVDNAVSGGFSVDYSFTDVSAAGGADYDNTAGTVNFVGTRG